MKGKVVRAVRCICLTAFILVALIPMATIVLREILKEQSRKYSPFNEEDYK